MPPYVPNRLLEPLSPKQWVNLSREIQTILAMAWFVLAGSAGVALIIWVLGHRS